ncbi:unnamed protein product [Durusdinium trenchii]|uniref:H(+)-exporting diphosphatase n=1 Tax=Durusdinium trenchii TaxID=1381693 RepID=A0ABP0K3W8_9DINO
MEQKGEEEGLVEGIFSWSAAWCMMLWIIALILSVGMGLLTYTGGGIMRISEEISFICDQLPPYGPAEQPLTNQGLREINEPFRYHLPQLPLYFALSSASLGLFMVCLFTTLMLLELQGHRRSVDISWLISKGVSVYMSRTLPCITVFLFGGGWYVYVASGFGTLICFIAGATLNMVSAKVGVNTCMASTARMAYAMGEGLEVSVTLGMRSGAIGGLLSTSLGLGGMALMWLLTLDTTSLSGFGSGASLVSFYLRVGGGIFSKGAEIGADLVGEMSEKKLDEERRVYELQQRMAEMEALRLERRKKGLDELEEDMMDKLRMMEEEMQDIASSLHPIDYLDAVGENICDVSGTCADLFESMVLILSLSLIIGARGSAVPYFFTSLPVWIVAAGNLACACVAHRSHVRNHFTSRQVRWYMRLNLLFVIVFVQLVQILVSYFEYSAQGISFEDFWQLTVISIMGQVAPEICVVSGEIFTGIEYWPVRTLAQNAHLGVVQVVLQGLGQGFMSTILPAAVVIVMTMLTWGFQGPSGLAILAASSVSGTGFQGGIASFGAIATNAQKIVHLTTYHSMTRHRANLCAQLGDCTAHAGNTISVVNAFSAVFNVNLTLLAETFTRRGIDYQAVAGSPLSEWSQAGLVLGVAMSFVFTANTTMSCLETSKSFMRFCQDAPETNRQAELPFPSSHYKALKILSSYGTVTSMRMVFNPLINTLVCPMLGGFFLGTRGLMFLLSGSNVLILCFSSFLMNAGQSWFSARRFILYGLLKDEHGKSIGPDSQQFRDLGVGEMIGGPFEDTSGPALNNFIKLVGVFALVTSDLYDPTPEETWIYGCVAAVASIASIFLSRYGLSLVLTCITAFLRQRQVQREHMEAAAEPDEEELAALADD